MIDLGEVRGEVALFRAVIAQAIADACFVHCDNGRVKEWSAHGENVARLRRMRVRELSDRQREAHTRDHARAWLTCNSRDFREVCALALLDPDAVREKALALASAGWPDIGARVH